jgi:hypothetical protein
VLEMAWLERRTEKTTQVCVVERRSRTVWERVAKGRTPGRGRIRLVGEHADESSALEAYRARISELEDQGFRLLDADAGVDAFRPRGAGTSSSVPAKPKRSVDQVLGELRHAMGELGDAPHLGGAFDALDRILRASGNAYRAKGFACDLGVRGEARIVIKVASVDGFWREIGLRAELTVPEERATEEECIDADSGSWASFASMVREDAAWQAVADLPCFAITIVDDEID